MSSRFESYYGRLTEMKPDIEYIRKNRLASVLDAPPGKFALIEHTDGSPEIARNSCQFYSKKIGEVIYVGIQENVNCFHYEHWKEGEMLRMLSYNSDSSWHRVAGTPEEWEKHALFSEDRLKVVLECYEEEHHEEIQRAWARKEINEDDQFPSIIEMDAYNALLSHI